MPDAVLSIMAPLFLMAVPLLSPFYKVGNQNTEFRMTNKESHFPVSGHSMLRLSNKYKLKSRIIFFFSVNLEIRILYTFTVQGAFKKKSHNLI